MIDVCRCYSINEPSAPDEEAQHNRYIGAYTPVTRDLWLRRGKLAKIDKTLPPAEKIETKAPATTTVLYQFSKDLELRENVGCAPSLFCSCILLFY